MKLEVVATPALLKPRHLAGRTVVVLDVLRATTTMTAALANGAKEIFVFDSVEAAAEAAAKCGSEKILHGERKAQPPPGFDLGNSPGDFTKARCCDRTCFMTTTNGTVAILAATAADELLIGANCNAAAVAARALVSGRDCTLLCAGQRMDVAMEDLIGCGSIIQRLLDVSPVDSIDIGNDSVHISHQLYLRNRHNLGQAFRMCLGARAELLLGLSADIDYCAVEDRFSVVGFWDGRSMSIKRAN
jgi:2-phosphosulfolactate phosphatase